MEQTLGETLLEIRNYLTEYALFSLSYICQPLKTVFFARFPSLIPIL